MANVDYGAIAQQYGGTPAGNAPLSLDNAAQRIPGGGVDVDALARAYGGRPEGEPLTPLQGAGAVASGFNRSIFAGIPGLPVKTALDVADLARAAYGTAGRATGLLTPEQMPAPLDRSQYPGSPEWIAAQLQRSPYTAAAINNPRPDLASARLLNAGGAGMGYALSGRPSDLAMQGVSGIAGQGASELGAPPAWSLFASMGPQAATSGAAMTTRGVMRGGEAGRQQMIDRTATFNQAGVNPTVGLATGQRIPQVVESLLSKTPGAAGAMAAKIADIQDQMGATANAARDTASPVYGPAVTGETIKSSITGYRQRQQNDYGAMNDRAMGLVPGGMAFPVSAMLARGGDTLAAIPGAPNVTRAINSPLGLTQDILGALRKDAAPTPPGSVPSPILQSSGQPFTTPTPGTPGGLPMEGIVGLKQRIGQTAYANNPLLADANTGALKSLYGGAKEDLLNAGQLADAQRIAQGQAPGVYSGLTRANRFYQATQDILEKTLAPIYRAGDPASEKSFYRVEGDIRNSGTQVAQLMSSLPVDARKQIVATVADRLGRASPGQQDAEGAQFSPSTFLTNFNRMDPSARQALFNGIPNGGAVAAKLDALAKSAAMIRDANRVYANSSGTAPAATMLGTGGALAGGIGGIVTGHTAAGLATLGTVLGSMAMANRGASAMINPRFVSWLADTTKLTPSRLQGHLLRLSQMASSEADPQERAANQRFANELNMELRAQQGGR